MFILTLSHEIPSLADLLAASSAINDIAKTRVKIKASSLISVGFDTHSLKLFPGFFFFFFLLGKQFNRDQKGRFI